MELAQAVADVDSDKGSDAHRPPPKCRAVSPSLRRTRTTDVNAGPAGR
jgi:hypothetical protein